MMEQILCIVVQNTDIPEIYYKLSILNKKIYDASVVVRKVNRWKFLREIKTSEGQYFILPNGNREGPYISYYENGRIAISCDYVNGRHQGKYINYYENGSIMTECNYLEDKLDGLYRNYYSNGILSNESNYRNGKLVYTHHYDNNRSFESVEGIKGWIKYLLMATIIDVLIIKMM